MYSLVHISLWLFVLITACSPSLMTPEPTKEILSIPQTTPASTISSSTVSATPIPTDSVGHAPTPTNTPSLTSTTIVGVSVDGRPIVSYRFGNGPIPIILVGGIHGGYEWNSILLAYEMIDHFNQYPNQIPENISLYIIPSANPDGQFLITGKNGRFEQTDISQEQDAFAGRFNANGVDLNRNWDCNWTTQALWRDQPINSGTAPFSEQETQVLRDYFLTINPAFVLFWHSAAGGVYSGGCSDVHVPSYILSTVYGEVSGYPVYEKFNAYPVTGDSSDWLTTKGIASFAVELPTHEAIDWNQNLAGVTAILEHFKEYQIIQ